MSLSIREEIYDVVEDAMYFKDEEDDVNLFVNKIMRNLEKRIDSLKEQLDSNEDKMMISTLNWVKEMLK